MFKSINEAYEARKRAEAENQLIYESVLDTDETLPGTEEELDDVVDPDSVPDDVYAKLDKELDKIVEDPNYDDTEAEEMVDDDFDEGEVSDADLDAIMDEAVDAWKAMEENANKPEFDPEPVVEASGNAGNNIAEAAAAKLAALKADKKEGSDEVKNEHVADFGGLNQLMGENFNDFSGGKYTSEIGKAYEAISNQDNKYAKHENEVENPMLRESAEATNFNMDFLSEEAKGEKKVCDKCGKDPCECAKNEEATNPDVEDFPGSEGTKDGAGDPPAGTPEPKPGAEDGNAIGGDDDVTEKEAKDVKTEDGGKDAVEVIKANEATSIIEAARKKMADAKKETCPKCGKDPCECKAEKNECDGPQNVPAGQPVGEGAVKAAGAGVVGSLAGGAAGGSIATKYSKAVNDARVKLAAAKADKKAGDASDEDVTKAEAELAKAKAAAGNKGKVIGSLAGGAAAALSTVAASAKKAKAKNEAVTNQNVEDFPGQTGAGNDHGEKEGALPQGQEPADFPNSTGDKKVNSGDEPTNRYKAVVEAVLGKSINGKKESVSEATTNPDVEDFPGSEGTKTTKGEDQHKDLPNEPKAGEIQDDDQSAFEQKEVKVEDGGTDAIDVVKMSEATSRYKAIAEAAISKRERMVPRGHHR